jgi:hypothetical protein
MEVKDGLSVKDCRKGQRSANRNHKRNHKRSWSDQGGFHLSRERSPCVNNQVSDSWETSAWAKSYVDWSAMRMFNSNQTKRITVAK